ncbi:MAG: DUF4337 domain-containing protein [Polyangiales bacterium]
MPDEIEVPTEHLHETVHEKAHEAAGGHGDGAPAPPPWVMAVALSSALIAVLAALSALLAGHYANEAMLEQMKASDGWAYFQAKSIKANVLQTKVDLLTALGKEVSAKDAEKIAEYGKEQKEIEEHAKHEEHASEGHMQRHSVLARAVTVFQIAIALSAIAVLTKKKQVWYGSMLLGVAGAAFMVLAYLH